MASTQQVKYVDLEGQWSAEKQDLIDVIDRVMSTGVYVGGTEIEQFENAICEYTGAKHCIALNSGTDALVCSMLALGLKPEDEVITPPNSFVASTSSVAHIGCIPVFADVLDDQSIDPDKIRSAITDKTKAIMAVHLTGRMAQMDKICQIADENNLFVIEDAAQSIGSKYKGVQSGRYGHTGCFSTHPLKNLNACGDGGFVITDDEAVSKIICRMRNHGLVDRNNVETFGYVSRMDAIQAAILRFRLENIDEVLAKRRHNAFLYKQLLDPRFVYWPAENEDYFDTYHTFVIQVAHRDRLKDHLNNFGIQTAIHYPIPIHHQPPARKYVKDNISFPVTERQANEILTLPINQFCPSER